MKKKILAVDFFCGAGGITRGLLDAGIKVKKGFDNDIRVKKTYEKNNRGAKFYCTDISELSGKDVLEGIDAKNNYLLLAGCAPCQPFSLLHRKDKTELKKKDIRTNLLLEFGRLIVELKPDFVIAENVPGLKNGRGKRIFTHFETMLKKEGYFYKSEIVDAKDYGVPQKRRRLVLLASRHAEVSFPTKTHGVSKGQKAFVTVRETIARFPRIKAGKKEHEISNHESRKLSDLNKERLKHIRKNGGTRLDLPEELQLDCHSGHSGHTDVYGRMKWDEVAPALTCKCTSLSNGRFGHPTQLRAISVREAAALQTFSDDYIFLGNLSDNTKWIGNAVPPLLAKYLGAKIKEQAK